MEPDDQLVQRVRAFVAVQTGYALEKITPETILASDVGLGGDDADCFLRDFCKEFDLPLRAFSALDFKNHFGGEGGPGLGCLLLLVPGAFIGLLLVQWLTAPAAAIVAMVLTIGVAWLYHRFVVHRHRGDLEPFRVRDLVEAAATKQWHPRSQ